MTAEATLIDGKYTILAKLREGGMGTIYKVQHNLLDEVRVIKLMKANITDDPDLQRRFQQEAKLVTKFKHPHIAAVYDLAYGEEGTAYIVMEYVEGVNLAELMGSQNVLSVELVLETTRQSLEALGYLHRKSVVHRDISPDNIMVTSEDGRPEVKLIDLGIAKHLDASEGMTKTGYFLGKLKYASPEQLGNLKAGEKLDARSDLYSTAVVMYELLTGRLPFDSSTPQALVAGHLMQEPFGFDVTDPTNRIPDELRAIVMKGLTKDRDLRFATAEEFAAALHELQRSRPNGLEAEALLISDLTSRQTPMGFELTITPSAQEKVNRQFAQDTRTPSRGGFTPTAAPSMRGRDLTEVDAELPVPPHSVTEPTRIARRGAPVAPATTEPTKSSSVRVGGAIAAVGLLGAAAVFFATRGDDKPVSPVNTAILTDAAASAPALPVPPTSSVAEVGVPAASAATPAAPLTTSTTVQEGKDDAQKAELDQARRSAGNSRRRADSLNASVRAPQLYMRGTALQVEAERDARDGQLARATFRYEESARAFEQASAGPMPRIAQQPPVTAVAEQRPAVIAQPEPAVERPRPVVERPAPEPVPAAPSPRPASDESGVRAAIARFEAAQEALDVNQYLRVYPSANRARVSAGFGGLRSQSMELDIRKVSISGTTATVVASQSIVISPKAAAEQRSSGERTFTLARQGEEWIITAIR